MITPGTRDNCTRPKTDWTKGRVTNLPPQEDGYVFILDDLELVFLQSDLTYIRERYNDGDTPEMIGYALERNPDEIFLALFHLARSKWKVKPFGRRML